MNFDFTEDSSEGVAIEHVFPFGIFLSVKVPNSYARTNISPEKAREIGHALIAAADHVEGK